MELGSLDWMVNFWETVIYPTFNTITEVLNTPVAISVDETIGNIPILGWIINAIISLLPNNGNLTLIELFLGVGLPVILVIAVIKFFVGIFTGS